MYFGFRVQKYHGACGATIVINGYSAPRTSPSIVKFHSCPVRPAAGQHPARFPIRPHRNPVLQITHSRKGLPPTPRRGSSPTSLRRCTGPFPLTRSVSIHSSNPRGTPAKDRQQPSCASVQLRRNGMPICMEEERTERVRETERTPEQGESGRMPSPAGSRYRFISYICTNQNEMA